MALCLLALGFACAGMASMMASTSASAATKHRHAHRHVAPVYVDNRPPLNVNKRSWLDPGPAVTPGTSDHYVVETSQLGQTPDQLYFPSRQHDDAMPRPFYVPGSMTPLVEFETPRDPFSP
ncbi:MAG: hypothetical protein ACLP8A_05125 [Methylovirgula sp.]